MENNEAEKFENTSYSFIIQENSNFNQFGAIRLSSDLKTKFDF